MIRWVLKKSRTHTDVHSWQAAVHQRSHSHTQNGSDVSSLLPALL